MTFQLHPRLKQDCLEIGCFELCRLLMMNDNQYPWFILVPAIPDVKEIYHLTRIDRAHLIEESSYLAKNLADLYKADKMNIATLGNMVSQLHIHHIVRYKNDPTWPAPVWGKLDAIPYSKEEIESILEFLQQKLTQCHFNQSTT
ncbi:MAG: HIT domain-containing protein [Gammaproteobacteria bacterium]|nr:HIT domain-containing protein [Gammaproteobacteria bacterium]